MYKGYKLEFRGFSDEKDVEKYKNAGKEIFQKYETVITRKLDSFTRPNGNFDGSALIENWFPEIDAQVFISHAHLDHDIALQLAGYLYHKFGITSFIDSCVWGYADELLKDIDNELSSIESNKYNYKQRNYTTSHVHMMLSTALNQMIYNTECFVFIKTNNSVPRNINEVVSRTESAWIYSEVKMSNLLKREKSFYRRENRKLKFSKGLVTEGIDYEIDDRHLSLLKWSDIQNMKNNYRPNMHPLDILYKVTENNELITS
jgi:hypothetical protein